MSLFGSSRSKGSGGGAPRPSVVAALDLGSTKVACLIARAEPGETLEVIGVGKAASAGVRAGGVVELQAAEEAVRAAVEEAERMARTAVSRISVSLAAGQLKTRLVRADTMLSNDRPVCDRDLRRALDQALNRSAEPGRVVVHAIPLTWTIDDQPGVNDPRGMYGAVLGVELLIADAKAGPLRNLAMCVEAAQLDIRGVIAGPYASGLGALSPDELELGATVIDLGAGTTSTAVFVEGALAHLDAIPIGGRHVTNDLAKGLSTPVDAAERIKRVDGAAFAAPEDCERHVPCPQLGDHERVVRASRTAIIDIIRPRLEEIFETVRDRLKAADMLDCAGRRVVLTGGGAELDGVAELAARLLDKRVRVSGPVGVNAPEGVLDDPAFARAAGVLRHALQGPREAISGPPRVSASRPQRIAAAGGGQGLTISRAAAWLRECF